MAVHLSLGGTFQTGTFDFAGKSNIRIVFPIPFKTGTVPEVTITPEGSAISLHKRFVTNKKAEFFLNQNSTVKGTWSASGEI
ncbi:MAG: hypothetical protein FD136_2031 [Chitinophagaceae bacterium]|nr:MAG: hypothetical protein FD136_2031 [Chitinophagaceae bacterium]